MQAVHASEIAECAETYAISLSRGATCSFTITPQVARPLPPAPFWNPPWAPKFFENPLKIALVLAVCGKVRARALQSARKRTFGSPRVPQGAKMEPKWNQIGPQNVLKIEVSQKSVESGLDPLFTVYTH